MPAQIQALQEVKEGRGKIKNSGLGERPLLVLAKRTNNGGR